DGIRDLTVTGVQTCALPIYLARIILAGESQPSRDAAYVRIDRQRRRAERVVHHHARRLPADARQLAELLALAGNVPAMVAGDPRSEERRVGKGGCDGRVVSE